MKKYMYKAQDADKNIAITAPLSPVRLRVALVLFSLLMLMEFSRAQVDTRESSSAFPVGGHLRIPLVTPEQATQFLHGRKPPPSDAGDPESRAVNRGQSIDRRPFEFAPPSGHDLPVSARTPHGFPRADFAIAPALRPPHDATPRGEEGAAEAAPDPASGR